MYKGSKEAGYIISGALLLLYFSVIMGKNDGAACGGFVAGGGDLEKKIILILKLSIWLLFMVFGFFIKTLYKLFCTRYKVLK